MDTEKKRKRACEFSMRNYLLFLRFILSRVDVTCNIPIFESRDADENEILRGVEPAVQERVLSIIEEAKQKRKMQDGSCSNKNCDGGVIDVIADYRAFMQLVRDIESSFLKIEVELEQFTLRQRHNNNKNSSNSRSSEDSLLELEELLQPDIELLANAACDLFQSIPTEGHLKEISRSSSNSSSPRHVPSYSSSSSSPCARSALGDPRESLAECCRSMRNIMVYYFYSAAHKSARDERSSSRVNFEEDCADVCFHAISSTQAEEIISRFVAERKKDQGGHDEAESRGNRDESATTVVAQEGDGRGSNNDAHGDNSRKREALTKYCSSSSSSILQYNFAIAAYGRLDPSKPDEAEQVFNLLLSDIENVKPNIVTYNCMMQVYASLKPAADLKRAAKLIETLEKGQKNHNVCPNLLSYAAFIDAHICSSPPQLDKALQVLKAIQKNGPFPNEALYIKLIKASTAGNPSQPDRALQVLEMMERSKLTPDLATYNMLISSYANQRPAQPEKALHVKDLMERSGLVPNDSTNCSLVKAYAQASPSQPEKARHILEIMERNRQVPDLATLNILIGAYCSLSPHQADRGRQVLLFMERAGLLPNEATFTTLINAYLPTHPGRALDVLETMQQRSNAVAPSAVFTCLINAFAQTSPPQADKARHVFDLMRRMGLKPDELSYTTLVKAYSQVRPSRPHEAKEVIDLMTKSGHFPKELIYSLLMSAYAHARPSEPDKAREVLETMLKNGMTPDEISYTTLINAYAQSIPSFPDKAVQIVELMKKVGLTPNEVTYNSLINAYAHTRPAQPDKARELLDLMHSTGLVPNEVTYTTLINAYSNANPSQPEKARDVLEMMRRAGLTPNIYTFNTLIKAYAQASPPNPREAERVLEEMRHSGCRSDDVTVTTLLRAYQNSPSQEDWYIGVEFFNRVDVRDRSSRMYVGGLYLLRNLRAVDRALEVLNEARRFCRPWPNRFIFNAARAAVSFSQEAKALIDRWEDEDSR